LADPTIAPRYIHNERMEICKGCDRFDANKQTCDLCGCYLPVKTAMANMRCPQDLWTEYRKWRLSGCPLWFSLQKKSMTFWRLTLLFGIRGWDNAQDLRRSDASGTLGAVSRCKFSGNRRWTRLAQQITPSIKLLTRRLGTLLDIVLRFYIATSFGYNYAGWLVFLAGFSNLPINSAKVLCPSITTFIIPTKSGAESI